MQNRTHSIKMQIVSTNFISLHITTVKHTYSPVNVVIFHTQDHYKGLIKHTHLLNPQPYEQGEGSFYNVELLSLSTAFEQLKQHPLKIQEISEKFPFHMH